MRTFSGYLTCVLLLLSASWVGAKQAMFVEAGNARAESGIWRRGNIRQACFLFSM